MKGIAVLSTASAGALCAHLLFSSVFLLIFFREWRHYNYKPRIINFASEAESCQGRDAVNGINLPQFSAASVPKVHDNSYLSNIYMIITVILELQMFCA